MSEKKKRGKEFDNPYSVAKAVTKGNAADKAFHGCTRTRKHCTSSDNKGSWHACH